MHWTRIAQNPVQRGNKLRTAGERPQVDGLQHLVGSEVRARVLAVDLRGSIPNDFQRCSGTAAVCQLPIIGVVHTLLRVAMENS